MEKKIMCCCYLNPCSAVASVWYLRAPYNYVLYVIIQHNARNYKVHINSILHVTVHELSPIRSTHPLDLSIIVLVLLLYPRREAYRFHFFCPSVHPNICPGHFSESSQPSEVKLDPRCIPIRPWPSSSMGDLGLFLKVTGRFE